MTEFSLLETYPHGATIEATGGSRGTRVYYIPARARLLAAIAKADAEGPTEEYLDTRSGFDKEALKEQVSAVDLAGRADWKVADREAGNIADEGSLGMNWGESQLRRLLEVSGLPIPHGVVKFSGSSLDHTGSTDVPARSPASRARFWALVQEAVCDETSQSGLPYADEIEQGSPLDATVPMVVLRQGDSVVAAYLAAHDSHSNLIGHALTMDRKHVNGLLDEVRYRCTDQCSIVAASDILRHAEVTLESWVV